MWRKLRVVVERQERDVTVRSTRRSARHSFLLRIETDQQHGLEIR